MGSASGGGIARIGCSHIPALGFLLLGNKKLSQLSKLLGSFSDLQFSDTGSRCCGMQSSGRRSRRNASFLGPPTSPHCVYRNPHSAHFNKRCNAHARTAADQPVQCIIRTSSDAWEGEVQRTACCQQPVNDRLKYMAVVRCSEWYLHLDLFTCGTNSFASEKRSAVDYFSEGV